MKKTILILFGALVFGCINDKSEDDIKIYPGKYNCLMPTIINEIEIDLKIQLILYDNGSYFLSKSFSVTDLNSTYENKSSSESGIWILQNMEFCIDNYDGKGFKCDPVSNISKESFTLIFDDQELIETVGQNWMQFIKQ